MSLLSELVDLVLPRTCSGCRARGPALCPTCADLLRAEPLGLHRPTPCPSGLPPLVAHAPFDGAVRRLLLAHKERGRLSLVGPLGSALGRSAHCWVPPGDRSGVVLAPVPSSAAAVRARGQDHAWRLARVAAAECGVPAERLLGPARRTADQSGLTTTQRALNLHGALVALAGPPRQVVLVDDVVTTGATLAEAARALVAGGHEVLGCATVAATQRRGGTR